MQPEWKLSCTLLRCEVTGGGCRAHRDRDTRAPLVGIEGVHPALQFCLQ